MAQPAPPPALEFALPTEPATPALAEQARRLLFGDGEMLRQVTSAAGGLAVNLALAAVILVATIWVSRWLSELTRRAIGRAHRRDGDTTLQAFAGSVVRYAVITVGMIGVLQQLGVKATSVIAVLGAASLAVGLALQGALSNVAAGVMLLVLRPYRVGDQVEINGKAGTVKGLDLFATRLADGENRSVFVPNAKVFGDVIVNASTPSQRLQLDFTIAQEDRANRALTLMIDTAKADRRVLADPSPWARMTGITDNGVKVTLRAWMKRGDANDGRFDLLKAVRDRLRDEGFTVPYPQQLAVEPHS
jgi:small conductance mechanosensitive channel